MRLLSKKFIARQFANPSGFFGRRFTVRWLTKANAPMNQLTLDQLAPRPQDRILEVGFGGGDLLAQILASGQFNRVAGIDRSPDMVRVVGRRLENYVRAGRLDLVQGCIEALPFPTGEFTKLCSVNTIYFWDDPLPALMECRRVLTEDGRLLLCLNSKRDLEKWPPHQHGFRLYEIAEVESMMRAAGFSNIEVVRATDPEVGTFYCVMGNATADSAS